MITAIDTNILARSILNDDEKQSPLAKDKIRKILKKDEIMISSYTILELVWIMKVKKKSKEIIISVLDSLLNTTGIIIANDTIVRHAFYMFKIGKSDFGDYLILSDALQQSCKNILTFDRNFAKEPQVELVTS